MGAGQGKTRRARVTAQTGPKVETAAEGFSVEGRVFDVEDGDPKIYRLDASPRRKGCCCCLSDLCEENGLLGEEVKMDVTTSFTRDGAFTPDRMEGVINVSDSGYLYIGSYPLKEYFEENLDDLLRIDVKRLIEKAVEVRVEDVETVEF